MYQKVKINNSPFFHCNKNKMKIQKNVKNKGHDTIQFFQLPMKSEIHQKQLLKQTIYVQNSIKFCNLRLLFICDTLNPKLSVDL